MNIAREGNSKTSSSRGRGNSNIDSYNSLLP